MISIWRTSFDLSVIGSVVLGAVAMGFRAVVFRGMFRYEVISSFFRLPADCAERSISVDGGSFLAESSFFSFALEFSL